jgi:hypothetical protein
MREAVEERIRVKYWEIIADNLSKAGWSWGWVSAVDSNRATIWIADAHRDNGKRFVVHADRKLTAVPELESVIRARAGGWPPLLGQMIRVRSRSSRKLSACVTSRNSSNVR